MQHIKNIEPASKAMLLDDREIALSNSDRLTRVRAICTEFEIEIIPGNECPKPGQTRATASIDRIMQKHGEGHMRMVLATLAETKA